MVYWIMEFVVILANLTHNADSFVLFIQVFSRNFPVSQLNTIWKSMNKVNEII